MRIAGTLAVSLSVLSLAFGLSSETRMLCSGFLPPNDMKIYVGDLAAKGIDEAAFHLVLDRAEAFYAPVFAAKGAKLVVNRKWTDPTVNASAYQSGKNWHINMYGGLARHKTVTADGFMLVVCHEIGHHLGGYPKSGWATNEGGSDYYGTLKCMRSLLPIEPSAQVDTLVKDSCALAFSETADRIRCENGTMAGVSVSGLLAELGGSKQPSLTTPDMTVVSRTNNSHPKAQCRLDTYYQAALCPKPVSEELSNTEPDPGACTTAAGYNQGVRPLCWFKPPASVVEAPLASQLDSIDEAVLRGRLNAMEHALSGRGI